MFHLITGEPRLDLPSMAKFTCCRKIFISAEMCMIYYDRRRGIDKIDIAVWPRDVTHTCGISNKPIRIELHVTN